MSGILRRSRLLAGLGAALVVAVGCGSGAGTPPTAGGAGGELRVVTVTEPTSLNPYLQGRQAVPIVEQFIRVDDDGQPTDRSLIESYERLDANTWHFQLRPGITFSNGEPLNAAAAVYSIGVARDDKATRFGKVEFSVVKDAKAVSDLAFDVTTTAPTAALARMFEILWAIPPAYYAQVGADAFGKNPIGTGAYKIETWNAGSAIRVVRNDAYWRVQPRFDSLTFSFAPDAASRAQLLITQEADVALNIPSEQRPEIEDAEGYKVLRYDSFLAMNVALAKQAGPLADDRLREAAALAIDRNQLVDAVLGGAGEGARPSTSYLGTRFGLGTPPLDPDPERARQLVGQVGGTPEVTVNFATGRNVGDAALGEAVSGMLEKAGFRVTRNPIDPAAFTTAITEQRLQGVILLPVSAPYPDPIAIAAASFSSKGNVRTCVDAQVDVGIVAATGETDADRRQSTIRAVETRAVNDLHCFLPVLDYVDAVGYSTAVLGLAVPRDGMIDYAVLSRSV